MRIDTGKRDTDISLRIIAAQRLELRRRGLLDHRDDKEWLALLMDALGDATTSVLEQDEEPTHDKLVKLAALALAWIEDLALHNIISLNKAAEREHEAVAKQYTPEQAAAEVKQIFSIERFEFLTREKRHDEVQEMLTIMRRSGLEKQAAEMEGHLQKIQLKMIEENRAAADKERRINGLVTALNSAASFNLPYLNLDEIEEAARRVGKPIVR